MNWKKRLSNTVIQGKLWNFLGAVLVLFVVLALGLQSATALPLTFAWDAGQNWPNGTNVELEVNGITVNEIAATQYTLDVPVQPGEVINARARAIPPSGYECGDPLSSCPPSPWTTLEQTLPAVPTGLWGNIETSGGNPMALSIATLTSGSGTSNPGTTASISPTSGRKWLAAVAVSVVGGYETASGDDLSISGAGLTWTAVGQVKTFGSRRALYVLKGTGTPSSGALTITFTTSAGATFESFKWGIVEITSTDATPYGTAYTNTSGSGTAASVTVSETPDAGDFVFFVHAQEDNNTDSLNSELDTSLIRVGNTTGARRFGISYDTSPDSTPVPGVTWTGSCAWAAIGFVINAGSSSSTITQPVSIDALIQKTGIASTSSLDALIQKSFSGSVSLDSLISLLRTGAVSIDGLIQANKSATVSVDGLIQAVRTGAVSIDAALAIILSATTGIDALLQKAFTSTASLDAIISGGSSVSTSIDGLIQSWKLTTAQIDALLQAGYVSTASIDALIQKQLSSTASLDALVQDSGAVIAALDALIQASRTGTLSLDAIITSAGTGLAIASLDALLQAVRAGTVSLDALIAIPGAGASVGLDALLSATGTNTISLDALLQATKTGIVSIDGLIQSAKSAQISIDGLLSVTKSGSISFDAIVGIIGSAALSLDAILLKTKSSGVFIDAIIGLISSIIIPNGRIISIAASDRFIKLDPTDRFITLDSTDRFIVMQNSDRSVLN